MKRDEIDRLAPDRQAQGWDVFDIGGCYQVQRDDEANILADDDAAIELARKAGLRMNDDGILEGEDDDEV